MKFDADKPTVLGNDKDDLYRQLDEILDDRLKVLNNMAMAQIKLGSDDAALQSLETVLRCQPNNIKALFRKAKVFLQFFIKTSRNNDIIIMVSLKNYLITILAKIELLD